jgi:anionic glutamate receptor
MKHPKQAYNIFGDVKPSRALFLVFLFLISKSNCDTLEESSDIEVTTEPDKELSAEDYVNYILNNRTLYNPDIRPRGRGVNGTGPTVVTVNMFLRSIDMIDDIKMEYRLQVTVRQEWIDHRLKFENAEFVTIPEDITRLWTPDLFFMNEKHAHLHHMMKPNIMIRVIPPEGQIMLSIRLSLTLSCPMDLKYYPLDKQTCVLKMGSYSWATTKLVFKWKDPRPIQLPTNLHLARFTMTHNSTDKCDHTTTAGSFSCLIAKFTFKRELGYYMIQNFIPCGMIVMVSWISFWLGASTIDARVSLGITTMLTVLRLNLSIRQFPSNLKFYISFGIFAT